MLHSNVTHLHERTYERIMISVVGSPSESRSTTSRTAVVSQSEEILTSSPSIKMRSSAYLDDLKFIR